MQVPHSLSSKLEARLREALKRARAGDRLRVILILSPEGSAASPRPSSAPASKSREDLRRQLLEQRRGEIQRTTAATREALEKLDLRVQGGSATRAVVVDGTAEQILASLSLDGVAQAELDHEIEI